jgi:type VI secretion system protein ImpG
VTRDDLLHYYERELVFIRKLAGEFAEKYPEVAGRLQLGSAASADPHVERLIEAFAMLTARIQLRLDDDFSEITDGLLGILYPHYLAPIPAIAIARLELDADAPCPPHGLRVERHTLLRSKPVQGVRCAFRTAYPLTLWPIRVKEAALVQASALGVPLPPEVRSALRLRLEVIGGGSFAELEVDRLRFYFDGQLGPAHRLHELFLRDPRGLAVQRVTEAKGTPAAASPARLLGPESIHPVGFERDEGLLVYPDESFLGYRIVQEYFAFAEKFLFVELRELGLHGPGSAVDVSLLLAESASELDLRVQPEQFALGCTPAVNLFEMTADPVRVTHRTLEYPVTPDARKRDSYEVYSIRSAVSSERGSGRITRYEPIYTARHGAGASGAYWYATRRGSLRKDDQGTDVFLSLVDESFNPAEPPSDVLTLELLCTNRDLPARLAFGDPRGDFEVQGQPGVARALCIRAPSEARRAPIGRGSRWRIISHLALNHLSLADEEDPQAALDALREILKLYDFSDSPATRQRIAGLIGVRTRRIVRRVGEGERCGFARGSEVELLFDPDQYAGTGVFLFASVLEVFLGLYTSLNSFTRTVARTQLREGVLKRWSPRAGEIPLL